MPLEALWVPDPQYVGMFITEVISVFVGVCYLIMYDFSFWDILEC